jgi:hypothetical protein
MIVVYSLTSYEETIMDFTSEKRMQALQKGREHSIVARALEPGKTRKQVQFSMSAGDLERLENFMEAEGIPTRSEALRGLLERAGF